MKAVVFFILLYTVVVLSQDEFPPCVWSKAQWATFNECASSQTQEIISRCIHQETSAEDMDTIKNRICPDQNKIEELTGCLFKDTGVHSNFMKCTDRLNVLKSKNQAGLLLQRLL